MVRWREPSDPDLSFWLDRWFALMRTGTRTHPHRRYCGNCLHARVRAGPTVYCEMGHGRPRAWLQFIKPRALGFMDARYCPDYKEARDATK